MAKVASTKPAPISRANSRVNGAARRVSADLWATYDLATAWVDPGPSPAGNVGPYLKAMRVERDVRGVEVDHYVDRIYPRHGSRSPRPVPELIGGVWHWVVP